MTKRDDGGYAFPQPEQLASAGRGMSLLDWFAGQAMGIVLRELRTSNMDWSSPAGGKVTARVCYELADAMIAEKRRRESEDKP